MKPFDPETPYRDQETYVGRVLHFYDMINPMRLFVGEKRVAECKELMRVYKEGGHREDEMQGTLWEAKSVLAAVTHPDTGDRLPRCFMPCSFIPANLPILTGMLLTKPTVFNSILWQWVNQSYNAGFNYANRPISATATASDDALKTTLMAYVSATGVSCSLAVGLNRWLASAKLSPVMAKRLGVAVPFAAVAGAGSFNIVAMRYKELLDGIPVFHPDTGAEVGTSVAAAKTALSQCAASRVFLPAPILLIPPYLMPVVRGLAPGLAATFLGKAFLDLCVLTTASVVALPLAIALFPQNGKLNTESLEPELRQRLESIGINHVRFNKGL